MCDLTQLPNLMNFKWKKKTQNQMTPTLLVPDLVWSDVYPLSCSSIVSDSFFLVNFDTVRHSLCLFLLSGDDRSKSRLNSRSIGQAQRNLRLFLAQGSDIVLSISGNILRSLHKYKMKNRKEKGATNRTISIVN